MISTTAAIRSHPLDRGPASRTLLLLPVLALTLAALLVGPATAAAARPTTRTSAPSIEHSFTTKLNRARTENGVRPLATRGHLVDVARSWAATMARRSTLAHNPELAQDVGSYRWVGENVSYGPSTARVHVALMRSPGHRANILNRSYTEIGIGAVKAGDRIWVVQVFRQPQR